MHAQICMHAPSRAKRYSWNSLIYTDTRTQQRRLLVCVYLSCTENDVISCDRDHRRKKNKSDGEWRKEKERERERGGSIEASQGGRCCGAGWGGGGGSRAEECCSVIDFRVVVLQCYCSDADQIKAGG